MAVATRATAGATMATATSDRKAIASAAAKVRWDQPSARLDATAARVRRCLAIAVDALNGLDASVKRAEKAVAALDASLGDLQKLLPK